MRIIVIGAGGTIGSAVADLLVARAHEVLRASRSGDVEVDTSSPQSLQSMFSRIDPVDAVVCCAGDATFGPLLDLTDDAFVSSIRAKLMAQVNVVRFGVSKVRDGGSFTLTSGAFASQPWPGVPVVAMVNGAIESFGRAAAMDLPRNLRLNVVSPPLIEETAAKMGMPGQGAISAAVNAEAYITLIEGNETGTVVYTAASITLA
jgi:NAD(P)-dependent dehydrogenase (short-subunit alcohol dehydrogenase family)